jgi:peptide/nickel transport system ATP-binding protein
MTLLSLIDIAIDLSAAGFLARSPRINILSDITLSLHPGETMALVGESGSGKTTLARAIMGLTPITHGTISFDGHPVKTRADITRLRRATAMMFQDATASLSPRKTVGALLTEPSIIHHLPPQNPATLLARVGLPASFATRFPHELSGGQARRVGVARALALTPKLVIADEPTAGLDVSVQADILNLMRDMQAQLGLAYLIITHNLAVVRHIADTVAVMYLGRVVESGPAAQIFANPAHPYTASLIASDPVPDPRQRRADVALSGEIPSILRRPTGCVFHTRCPISADICRTENPALQTLSPTRSTRCHFPIGASHAMVHQ